MGKYVSSFGEDKDKARQIREKHLAPALGEGESIVLDFSDVEDVTQSFIHALISEMIRVYTPHVLDLLEFKNCNEKVKTIISIVVEYTQDNLAME